MPWCGIRRPFTVVEFEQITVAPKVMAFALEIFARRFSLLASELRLLLPDPSYFGYSKNPCSPVFRSLTPPNIRALCAYAFPAKTSAIAWREPSF